MIEAFANYIGGDDESEPDEGPSDVQKGALFDRHRTDRASVSVKVWYVFLGAITVIGTAVVASVVF